MSGTALSPLRLMAWGALALGGVLILSFLVRLAQVIWRRFAPLNVWRRYAEEASPLRRRRGLGWLANVLVFLLALLLVGFGGLLFYLEDVQQSYLVLPPDDEVAQVQCEPVGEEEATEELSCSLVGDGSPYSVTLALDGGRWAVEVETLVWDPALEQLGFRSGYRILRFGAYRGEGLFAVDVPLSPEEEGVGAFFLRLDEFLPLFRADREILAEEAAAGRFYELSLSRTGFTLREWELERP